MLQLKKVTKIFNKDSVNRKTVLNGLDLAINPGDFITIIGSNGAGKSTLLNAIAGAFPLESGRVLLGGEDITDLPAHKRAGFIGRVFQDPMVGTAGSMTIEENLSIAERRGSLRGFRIAVKREQRERMKKELSYFGLRLEERLKTPVGLLSGGQRQALTLLMAIFNQPKLLLLDEHTAALDPKTGGKVLDLTEDLVESLGLTTLMVTHNIADSLKMGNRTIMMHEGKVILDIKGDEKKGMTPRDVLKLFESNSLENKITDRMLLAQPGSGAM